MTVRATGSIRVEGGLTRYAVAALLTATLVLTGCSAGDSEGLAPTEAGDPVAPTIPPPATSAPATT